MFIKKKDKEMANTSAENNCGCLYFYSKKGLSDPCYLTLGKTTIGSDLQCNIRIKGIENMFCILDSNEAGFTVLVNSNEDERVLLNGVHAPKYSVLTHDDHFQLGDKKFKYSKPDINVKDLESFRKSVANKLVGNCKIQSKRKSMLVSPLKRLQYSSPRRFSTGSRINEIKLLSIVPERKLPSQKTSTPLSAFKTRMSQRVSRPRHSALGVLKENEMMQNAFDDDSSKADLKYPTPKNTTLSTCNLKELDLNSTVSSCCTPVPTRKKMYSGNLSDVSDFTTPENNVSVENITPLNVSKRKSNVSRCSLGNVGSTYVESSTPKSAVRRLTSSSRYRPIVEEITPVSPLPRSSLRISSLKKPSFTQRRSVNFQISSTSECSLLDSDLVENVSFKPGSKMKRSLSDNSGCAYMKKVGENAQQKDNLLVYSVDSCDDIGDLKNTDASEHQEKTTSMNEISTVTSTKYDSDPEDVCVSLTHEDTLGRQYIDNSSGRYTGRKTSIHKQRKSNSYSIGSEMVKMSRKSRVNSLSTTVDKFVEAVGEETTSSSGVGETAPRIFGSAGRRSMSRRNTVRFSTTDAKTPKKSIDTKYAKTPKPEKRYSSDKEGPECTTEFDSSISSFNVSPKNSRSHNATSEEIAFSDSINLSLSDASSLSGRVSTRASRIDNGSLMEDAPEEFVIGSKSDGRTSTPMVSNKSRSSITRASTDDSSKILRPNLRSKSLNLPRRTRSTISKKSDNSLLTRQLKRRFAVSVAESFRSPIVYLGNSIISTPPSEASSKATYGSKSTSPESLSENFSPKHTDLSSKSTPKYTTRRSLRDSTTNISGVSEMSSRNSLDSNNRTSATTPVIDLSLDKSTKRVSSTHIKSKLLIPANDDSLSDVSLKDTDKSYTGSRKSSVGQVALEKFSKSPDPCCSIVSPTISHLSKTSNSISYSFIDSSLDGSLEESVDSSRNSRRSLRSIGESVFERSKLNSSSRRSNNNSATSKRIREWIQSPMEEDDEVFQSYQKDPTDIKVTEATFSKFLESPEKTPKTKKRSSANLVRQSDPTDITGLRRLLKTPKKSIALGNEVTNARSADKSRLSTIKKHENNISSNNLSPNLILTKDEDLTSQKSSNLSPYDLSNTEEVEELKERRVRNSKINDQTNIAGNKKRSKTPKGQNSPRNYLTNIGGIKKLMATPKIQNSPRNDLTNIVGVKKLLKTPKKQKSPRNDLTNILGVKKLLKTPKEQNSPRNDLTRIVGVKKLMATPKIQNSPKNDLTNIAGVKKLLKTPKEQNSPRNDLTNVGGIKKLMATPRIQNSPRNDLTNIAGVKKLLKTPKEQNSPRNDLTNIGGIKKLMATPRIQNSPRNDLTNVAGVKQLLKSPKEQKSPRNDLTNICGIKKLMATPKECKSPKNDLTTVFGVKRLLRTPKEPNPPKNDLTCIAGVKKLMRTPKEQKSPNNDLSNVAGVKRVLRSPLVKKSPKNDLSDLAGVKKLMKTPAVQKSPVTDLTNVTGIGQMMKTPRQRKSINSPNNDLTNIVGLKKLLATPKQQRSPENDLSDVRGVKQLLKTPKVLSNSNDDDVLNSNNDFELSGIDWLFNESVDTTFDNLLGKKALRTYSKSPKKQKISGENPIGLHSPIGEIAIKNSHSQSLLSNGSTRSRKRQKVLYNSNEETVHVSDVDVNETSTSVSTIAQTNTPNRNEALEMIMLESSRSKKRQRNVHVPKVELDPSSDVDVKVTSTPASIQNENEKNIGDHTESKKGKRNGNKRKHVDSDDEKPKNPKIRKRKVVTKDNISIEISESKVSTKDIEQTSTSDGNQSVEIKTATRVVGKATRSRKIINNGNEAKEPTIEEQKMRSRSTRRNNTDNNKNENLSQNNSIEETKRKRRCVKENAVKGTTDDIGKSNELKDDVVNIDIAEIAHNSPVKNLRTRTRRGQKENESIVTNETDTQNVSLDSNAKNKGRSRKIKESTENDEETERSKRRGRKKDSEVELESLKVKEKLTDDESDTQKRKKNVKIIKVNEIETHNNSLDVNSKLKSNAKGINDSSEDNEGKSKTDSINEKSSTKTRRGKKELEKKVTDENSFETNTKKRRGRYGRKVQDETSDTEVRNNVSESKRRGEKAETRKDIGNFEVENSTQSELESSETGVKYKNIRNRTRNKKETQNNDTTEDVSTHDKINVDSHIENEQSDETQNNKSKDENISVITRRNTRANRGQFKKYDEIEWHTPVKSPNKKRQKNVAFSKNLKTITPTVESESPPVRMTRSRRTKK